MKGKNVKERARGAAFLAVAGLLLVLAAASVVGSIFLVRTGNSGALNAGSPVPSSDPAIDVDGNAQLAAAADSGSGTAGDPYIIENKIIDAGGTGSAIHIRNTDAYLIIRNCTATGSRSDWLGVSAGIKLQNVTNANVSGNTVSGNGGRGIYLSDTHNNTVSGNTVSGNGWEGIRLFTSHHNNVSGNTVSGNGMHGINLGGSNTNTVSDNAVAFYMLLGHRCIYDGGADNSLTGNQCFAPDLVGLILAVVIVPALAIVLVTLRRRAAKKSKPVEESSTNGKT